MKRGTRHIIKCFIAVAIIVFIVGTIWIGIYSIAPPDANKADRMLKNDGDLLNVVVCYLKNFDEDLYIYKNASYDKIEDKTVIEAIKQLFKRKYIAIGKNGNTIYFLKWTRWKDFGAGIAYTVNGCEKPVIDYLVKLEPLSKNQWYYYEIN